MFKRMKFRFTFGLSPIVDKYKPIEKDFVQRAVDIRLTQLAIGFLSECRSEKIIKVGGASTKDVAQNLVIYRRQHRLVMKAKSRFWKASALAERFGYKAKQHARDYVGNDHTYLIGVEEL